MRALHYRGEFSKTSETFIYEYIRGLERQGVDNHVLTHRRVNEDSRPFPKVHTLKRPSRWHPRRVGNKVRAALGIGGVRRSAWPQMREQFRSLIEDLSPDVIHAHFGPSGVLIGPVSQKTGVPLVVTFYGYDVSRLAKKTFWKERYNELWQQADRVTVLSEKMSADVERMGCPSSKVKIVHLSRDLDQFPFQKPEGPVKNVLFVGRLTPKKAPIDALRAVQIANENGAGLTLEMVGDGPMYEEVEAYVDEQNLMGDVKLHGRLPNDEVAQHMQTADAFLLPSKTTPSGGKEGTPTVLVEAQAAGLPCVTTQHSGIPEMIPKENHDLLSPEGCVESLARSLNKLSGCTTKKLSERTVKGRKKVKSDFNILVEVDKIDKIYESIS